MHRSLLTTSDVAQLLKLNVETVYSLIRREGLPAARVGGQWRFSEDNVRAWLESRQVVGIDGSGGTPDASGDSK